MEDKKFLGLLVGVVCVCTLLTLAHLAYAIQAYQQCSIIQFIAGELW